MKVGRLACVLSVFILLFPLATVVSSQTLGMIEGRVIDSTGAVLPGATVSVTNVATSIARVAVTNTQGLFRALNLNPGQYEVQVEMQGFRTAIRKNVNLTVGETVNLNFTLDLQSVAESVEVTGNAPLVNTVNSEVGQTVDTRKVTELPLNGRDFTRLSLLAPGAVQTGGGFATLAFNGTGAAQNNFMLDGVDARPHRQLLPVERLGARVTAADGQRREHPGVSRPHDELLGRVRARGPARSSTR